jgi:hypothetical protein
MSSKSKANTCVDLTGGHARAGVLGVLGASEDGSVVYFVAEGALTGSEENAAGQKPVEGADNLYVYQAGAAKPLRFLGRLSSQDDHIQPGGYRLCVWVIGVGVWRSRRSG